jgi:hypothetical protein
VPFADLLRFNRGNALLGLGRHEDARREYERCIDLPVPDWKEPRVNLVAALCALGQRKKARSHVEELAKIGLDPNMLAQLRDQVSAVS